MDSEENIVRNRTSGNLSYMAWYEHVKYFFTGHWKIFFLYWVGGFGVFWGVIEAASFFYPELGVNNPNVLLGILAICFLGSLRSCIYDYRSNIPVGLESESAVIHGIARS